MCRRSTTTWNKWTIDNAFQSLFTISKCAFFDHDYRDFHDFFGWITIQKNHGNHPNHENHGLFFRDRKQVLRPTFMALSIVRCQLSIEEMVAFEDFFAKKKIDLPQLEADNRVLYAEFREHYRQMGEKSFDHSKKFWFNRLRKTYPLKEAEPEKPTSERKEPSPATDGEPPKTPIAVSAPAAKLAGFKPRFKATAAKPVETESVEVKPKENTTDLAVPTEEKKRKAAKPAGFRPRFRPGITKTVAVKTENT